jgi:hypothetical protein
MRQVSGSVHGSPSVQAIPSDTGVPLQMPARQASEPVHWFPSVQAVPSIAGLPTHKPAAHLSPVVQGFWSLQRAPSPTPLQESTTARDRCSTTGGSTGRSTQPANSTRIATQAARQIASVLARMLRRWGERTAGTAPAQHLRFAALSETIALVSRRIRPHSPGGRGARQAQ